MTAGSILLVDDEETFRESTCRLLRREEFDCLCVPDAEEAIESLRRGRFDVLVADIRMPRNPDLRVVREARKLDSQMAVILVTGYPSTETAISAVEMSVAAYLTKPLDFSELLRHVRAAADRSRRRRALSAIAERLQSALADVETAQAQKPPRDEQAEDIPLPTIRTLAASLSDLLILRSTRRREPGSDCLCEILDCPQRPVHRQAILDAIEVLKQTKETFKSKTLAELRAKLERVVGVSQEG